MRKDISNVGITIEGWNKKGTKIRTQTNIETNTKVICIHLRDWICSFSDFVIDADLIEELIEKDSIICKSQTCIGAKCNQLDRMICPFKGYLIIRLIRDRNSI